MDITLSVAGGIPVFHLGGRLDVTTCHLVEERLRPLLTEEGRWVVFSCSDLSYVSSAGLRVFISTQRQLKARGGGVAFSSLSAPVRDLFTLAGLDSLFVIEDSLQAAVVRLTAGK
ncbi:MAG: STAS domain-containing protein [Chthoniobacterales bacterium]|jgi:anti-anti-sigma factor